MKDLVKRIFSEFSFAIAKRNTELLRDATAFRAYQRWLEGDGLTLDEKIEASRQFEEATKANPTLYAAEEYANALSQLLSKLRKFESAEAEPDKPIPYQLTEKGREEGGVV